MGVSVENRGHAFRIDHLRQTHAHTKFLSLEPLLGPLPNLNLTGIDRVIVGGESGPGARPMKREWVTEARVEIEPADLTIAAPAAEGGAQAGRSQTGTSLRSETCHPPSMLRAEEVANVGVPALARILAKEPPQGGVLQRRVSNRGQYQAARCRFHGSAETLPNGVRDYRAGGRLDYTASWMWECGMGQLIRRETRHVRASGHTPVAVSRRSWFLR